MPKEIITNRFKFEQTFPENEWTIEHGLNINNPVVDVWFSDDNGHYVNSDVYEVVILNPLILKIKFGEDTQNIQRSGIALIT